MRVLSEREERHAVRADLITLEAASALAFDRIYGRPKDAISVDTLDARSAIAHALAIITTVYTFDDQKKQITQIESRDLRGGVFQDGGRLLAFPAQEARPRITRLAIRASAMPSAIEQLGGMRETLALLMRNVIVSGGSTARTV